MRIRRRLIAIMIVLVALGLVAVDVVTYSSLHSFLYGRTDDQLSVAQDQVDAAYLHDQSRGVPLSAATVGRIVSPEVYVEILDRAGKPVLTRPSGSKLLADPPPQLPAQLPVRAPFTRRELAHGSYRPDAASVNVPSTGDESQPDAQYRLQASALPGGTLVVAARLDSVNATLSSLLHVELAVSAGVVVALLIMLTLLITRGLRPLEDMTAEAGAIAAGDLTRRVQPADDKSEIGRLGKALNGMLAQIELAFDKQRISEDRLRRFLSDASHELRTPLTSIRGYAELLRKDALEDDEARERALARIESESARMGMLVDDLLILARMGESPVPENMPVDLAAIVADAVEDARALDPSRQITLTTDHAIIEADEKRIEQLIRNLLQNALVHTPAGTPVDVQVEQSGNQTILRVRDEGPGLDTEQASRVFDRFYRGASSGRQSGSGLGLYIVATVAKSLGGDVRVDTAPGKGASFVVVLPGPDIGPDSQNNGPRTPTDPRADSRSIPGNPRSGAPSEATPSEATPSEGTPSEGTPSEGTPSRASSAPDPIEVHEPDTVRH
ncbi:MAG TPA: ATP-binding protein [Acidimicrobiales bacterium]|nr:ATP-binding protein [Acidimicrobiales bacterium]